MKNMRRQLLAITILCILTITSFAALLTIPTKAATSEATVLSSSWYIAPYGGNTYYDNDLVAVGEVENVGTTNIAYMYVRAYAYSNDTLLLISPAIQIYGNNLEPGQKAPFYIDFANPGESTTGDNTYTANVTNVVVGATYVKNSDDEMYTDLTVTSESSTASGVYTVLGSVKNTGSQVASEVRVITTFYNSSGTVVSVNYTDVLSDSLKVGSSVSFAAVPVDGYSGEIHSYATLVQTTANIPTTTATPTSTPTATATPTTSTSTSTTPTTIPQDNQDYTLLIAGAVVVVVIVLVAVVLFMRRNRGQAVSTPMPENTSSPPA
jgi:hypothetical protein